jgi:hypothetical protein
MHVRCDSTVRSTLAPSTSDLPFQEYPLVPPNVTSPALRLQFVGIESKKRHDAKESMIAILQPYESFSRLNPRKPQQTMGVRFRYTTSRRRTRLYLRYAILFFLVWNFVEVFYILHRVTREIDVPSWKHPAYSPVSGRKVFIASIHWNNEPILRERWNDAVVELVKALHPDNVFVSIYESGSWDDTKGALRDLDRRLASMDTPRNITLSDTTHADEISQPPGDEGWVTTSTGKKELRRIPYLARLRNISLRPLMELHRKGVEFDRVLFLNDVAFTVSFLI